MAAFDLEKLCRQRESAMELLALMSFFLPSKIPLCVVLSYSENLATGLASGQALTAKTLRKDLAVLVARSILTIRFSKRTANMSTHVQSQVQVWLCSMGATDDWKQIYLKLIAQQFPTGQYENWARCQQLAPHVEHLNPSSLISITSLEAWAHTTTNLAWYQWQFGEQERAHDHAVKSLNVRLKVFGQHDERTVRSMEVLASILLDLGSYEEAERWNRQAIEWRKANMEPSDPSTIATTGNLAMVLLCRQRYSESEQLHRWVLRESEKALGPQHVDTLTTVSNLALVLRSQARHEEAEVLDRRALSGFRTALGPSHPSTLTSANNLAMVLQGLDRYGESEDLLRWSLKKKLKKLGPDHPSTKTSQLNLEHVSHKAFHKGPGPSHGILISEPSIVDSSSLIASTLTWSITNWYRCTLRGLKGLCQVD